jgi:DNA-binding response OmpR family regulator
LIVDDDPAVRETTTAAFELAGYVAWPCESGEHALRCIEMRGLPHVAVVDLAMPGLGGVELSRRIRSLGDIPIVILTGNTSQRMTADLIAEFADDYITKPVELEVLVARVGRVLRRVREPITPASAVVTVDDRLAVDPATCRATVDGQLVQLTPTEAKLLRILLRNAGRTVASTNLVRRLWPCEEVFEDALRVHVHRLRQKIEADPRRPHYIHTCRGTGYRFAVAPPAGSSGGTRAPDV